MLAVLVLFYLVACDFHIPLKNFGKKTESSAYVDSVRRLQLFDLYSYNQIYYHYVFDDCKYSDSITSNRIRGNINQGDSLVIVISKMNPSQHSVRSLHGISQEYVQYMGR